MRYDPKVTYTPAEVILMISACKDCEHLISIWNQVYEERYLYCLDDLQIMRECLNKAIRNSLKIEAHRIALFMVDLLGLEEITCSACGALNCKNNESCIRCGCQV